jgi:hypothetical protein
MKLIAIAVAAIVATTAALADEVDPEFACNVCTTRVPTKLTGNAKAKWIDKCTADMVKPATAAELKAAHANAAAHKGGVPIGYSPGQVRASSWGAPQKVNLTTTANHVREQWVYPGGHLYFDDGVLTAIQN